MKKIKLQTLEAEMAMFDTPPPRMLKHDLLVEEEEEATTEVKSCESSLPNALLLLFGLNGSTLALPSVAMMYIVNDRVQIPVDMLSAYGALSFLPWSFKPLFVTIDELWGSSHILFGGRKRHELLALMLVCSSVLILSMVLVPPNGMKLCFLFAFLQNIATAFAEFLLGLTLLDQLTTTSSVQVKQDATIHWADHNNAMQSSEQSEGDGLHIHVSECDTLHPSFPLVVVVLESSNNNNDSGNTNDSPRGEEEEMQVETLGGIYQGQAATARNIGSLAASLLLFGLLLLRGYTKEISYNFCIFLLFLTSTLPLFGSVIAMRYKVGSRFCSNDSSFEMDQQKRLKTEAESLIMAVPTSTTDGTNTKLDLDFHDDSSSMVESLSTSEKATIAALQMLVIWVGLKSVISRTWLWLSLFVVLLLSLLCLLTIISAASSSREGGEATNNDSAQPPLLQRNIALYLVLVQTMPSAAYQWYGYAYYLFGSAPIVLQILSLVASVGSVAGSNAYAQHIAPRVTSRSCLVRVIGITTIVSATASLLYLIVTIHNKNTVDVKNVLMQNFLFVLVIGAITSFFGQIRFLPFVALATSSSVQSQRVATCTNTCLSDDDAIVTARCQRNAKRIRRNGIQIKKSGNSSLQYGAYISCIDFGDQLGTWITIPIVSALGITRGDWSKMTELILLCSVCSLFSLTFLLLLSSPRAAKGPKQ